MICMKKAFNIATVVKNSLNGHIDGRTLGSIAPKAYISFKKNSGEIVNMFILYMNHRTVSKMIDCIKEEMKKNNNLRRAVRGDEKEREREIFFAHNLRVGKRFAAARTGKV